MENQEREQRELPSRIEFVDLIPLEQIQPDPDPVRGQIHWDHVAELVESMALLKMGPLDPLLVKPLGNNQYQVLCGNHRLMALKQGGWLEAPCHVIEPMNDEEEFLMKLHSNTKRRNLTDLEACEALVVEKRIYESFYPETRHGSNRPSPCVQFAHTEKRGYAAIKARALGVARSTLQRDLQVGQLLLEVPELKAARISKHQALQLAQRPVSERQVLRQLLQGAANKQEALRLYTKNGATEMMESPANSSASAQRMSLFDSYQLVVQLTAILRMELPWQKLFEAHQLSGKPLNRSVFLQLSELALSVHQRLQ